MAIKMCGFLGLALVVVLALLIVPSSGQVTVVKVMNVVRAGADPASMTYDFGKGEIFMGSGAPYSTKGNIYVLCDANNSIVANIELTFEMVNRGYGSLYGLAYDSGKGEIFASIAIADTVAVISDNDNSVVSTINVGRAPMGVVYDSGKNEIFVANHESNTVSVISDVNDTVVKTINVPENPVCLVCDSAKGEIFVASYPSNVISVISDETNSIVATIPVNIATGWQSMAYDSSKGAIFAVNLGTDTVSVITNTVRATVSLPSNTMTAGIAFDSNTGEVLVGNIGPDSLSVISCNNNTVVQIVSLPAQPFQIVCDSGRGEIFVSNGDGSVTILTDSSGPHLPPPTVPNSNPEQNNESSDSKVNETDNQSANTDSNPDFPALAVASGAVAIVVIVAVAVLVYVKKRSNPLSPGKTKAP